MSHVGTLTTRIKIGSKLNQAIKAHFESRSRDQGNLWTKTNKGSRTRGSNSIFDQEIESFWRDDQTIKHTFTAQKSWSRLQQATCKWLYTLWITSVFL